MPATAGNSRISRSAVPRHAPSSRRPSGWCISALGVQAPCRCSSHSAWKRRLSSAGMMPSKRRKPASAKVAICSLVRRLISDLLEAFEHELVLERPAGVAVVDGRVLDLGELDHAPAIAHGGDHVMVGPLFAIGEL